MEITIMTTKPQRQSGKLVVVINIVLVGSITNKFHCNYINVGHELTNCMLNRGIKDKVSVITSDNASNMTVAIGVQKLGCLALASNKALSLPLLQRVLANVRSVDTFFHQSNIATEVLQEKQLTLQLPKHK